MTERLDDQLEDLLEDAPEGHAMDEMEAGDDEADSDELEDSLEEYGDDELEESMDSLEMEDESDALEDAMADALEAEDADEFWGALKNIGKTIGKVARVAKPFTSLLPGGPLIGAAADILGNLADDEADEMDALEELADLAEEEDGWDELAPHVAAVAIRGALKHQAARLPKASRKKLVKTVTAVTKHIAHKHGARAVAAVPAIVEHARKIAVRRRIPARHLPALVARTARAAVKSPRVLRKLVVASSKLRTGGIGGHRLRHHRGRRRHGAVGFGGVSGYGGTTGFGTGTGTGFGTAGSLDVSRGSRRRRRRAGLALGSGGGAAAGGCPHCQRRVFNLAGPVTLTIRSR
jgi:hypothetical protein